MRKWFAVQTDRTDAWDNGSHCYEEAAMMLLDQGAGLIAVIDEDTNTCMEEITYEELKDGDIATSMGGNTGHENESTD